mmetsp:Transcript_36313/g.81664  ORF Transcript_36313/g.81664 Transcript_36313/m.81664 type:complete len:86 (+) Transcript_36313:747-1004(+)
MQIFFLVVNKKCSRLSQPLCFGRYAAPPNLITPVTPVLTSGSGCGPGDTPAQEGARSGVVIRWQVIRQATVVIVSPAASALCLFL